MKTRENKYLIQGLNALKLRMVLGLLLVGAFSSSLLTGCMNEKENLVSPAADPNAARVAASSAKYPADVLNLTNWKITLPINTDQAGNPDEIKQPQLKTFKHDTYFHVNSNGDGVVFRAHAGGATTKNSGYPRSELREMTDNGKKNAAWSSSSGKHTMYIDQKITHLPNAKKHVVVGQIHDGEDDVIVFRLEKKKLFIDIGGDDGPTLTSNYELGTRFNVKFVVSKNKTQCYYNGQLKYTLKKKYSNAYFKAGMYTQSSCKGKKKVSGESCNAYGESEIYDLWVKHE